MQLVRSKPPLHSISLCSLLDAAGHGSAIFMKPKERSHILKCNCHLAKQVECVCLKPPPVHKCYQSSFIHLGSHQPRQWEEARPGYGAYKYIVELHDQLKPN
jgi:hypothetical protein